MAPVTAGDAGVLASPDPAAPERRLRPLQASAHVVPHRAVKGGVGGTRRADGRACTCLPQAGGAPAWPAPPPREALLHGGVGAPAAAPAPLLPLALLLWRPLASSGVLWRRLEVLVGGCAGGLSGGSGLLPTEACCLRGCHVASGRTSGSSRDTPHHGRAHGMACG